MFNLPYAFFVSVKIFVMSACFETSPCTAIDLPPPAAISFHDALGCVLAGRVVDHNGCAFGSQSLGDCRADALRSSGYYCNLVGKLAHRISFLNACAILDISMTVY
jgi:hypothetical protein